MLGEKWLSLKEDLTPKHGAEMDLGLRGMQHQGGQVLARSAGRAGVWIGSFDHNKRSKRKHGVCFVRWIGFVKVRMFESSGCAIVKAVEAAGGMGRRRRGTRPRRTAEPPSGHK